MLMKLLRIFRLLFFCKNAMVIILINIYFVIVISVIKERKWTQDKSVELFSAVRL